MDADPPKRPRVRLLQIGQNLSDPFEMEFPSLDEALGAPWGSLKDRWGPPPKPFVVAQGTGSPRRSPLSCTPCSTRILSKLCYFKRKATGTSDHAQPRRHDCAARKPTAS